MSAAGMFACALVADDTLSNKAECGSSSNEAHGIPPPNPACFKNFPEWQSPGLTIDQVQGGDAAMD